MAIYKLAYEEYQLPQEPKYIRQWMQRYGNVLRYAEHRKPWKAPLKQRIMMIVLTDIARTWRKELTAAQRLQWGTAKSNLEIRDDTLQNKTPWTRFVQVQTPLHYAGLPLVSTSAAVKPYAIQGLLFLLARVSTQKLTVYYQLQRSDLTAHRSVMHVSQVPPEYYERETLWKYAKMIGSNELSTDVVAPDWSSESNDYDTMYPFKTGDKLQLYIRITNQENLNPPISLNTSHETTEEWTLLTVTATDV